MNARRFTAHRALPLDVVEARARESRVSWGMTCQTCNTGTPGDCDCMPKAGFDAPELLADPPRQKPPAYPWNELMAGLLVVLFVVSVVHVVARAFPPAVQVAGK